LLREAVTFRVAAIGDLHIWGKVPTALYPEFESVRHRADVLVITGDITNNGMILQAQLAADLLSLVKIPIVAVMGNHDRRALMRMPKYSAILEQAGVTFLRGSTYTIENSVGRLGFAGVSGSGGGFWPDEGPDTIGRRTLQLLAVRARREANRLDDALSTLDTDIKVVVTHVSPTTSTLGREPVFKYFLLGNCEFGRVVDRHNVDLVLHGHAHLGNMIGQTAGGVPVRNVAQDVSGGIIIHELDPKLPVRLTRSVEQFARVSA
jgi:Icc-related predicted phosphoesterase